jgi:hypothetical protein
MGGLATIGYYHSRTLWGYYRLDVPDWFPLSHSGALSLVSWFQQSIADIHEERIMPETKSTSEGKSDTPEPQVDNPRQKKRLNLDLTPEAYELLQKLADESGKNMADVLRTGLALYGIAREESKKGRSLAVVEDEKVKKEIVIP